jgi:DnaD/phage-associated family protein
LPEYIRFEKNNHGVFVDADFINKLMPTANGDYVKIYLYALMCAENGEVMTKAGIADRFGLLESDVARAFEYWRDMGALKMSEGVISFAKNTAPVQRQADTRRTETQQTELRGAPKSGAVDMTKRPNVGEAADALAADDKLAEMCMLAQDMLGKTLTAQDTSTLYWFYDTLGFAPEIILMLLEYCASKDKRNMNYIEKIAITWHEKGIHTMEQVEAYIKKENDKGGYLNVIRRIMGITDRAFSRTEEEYLYKWRDKYGMGEDMVALAYEYCVIQTSKVSFPYMDRILERWNTNGIHTVAQAEADNESFRRSAGGPQSKTPSGAYRQPEVFSRQNDDADLEKIVWNNIGKN